MYFGLLQSKKNSAHEPAWEPLTSWRNKTMDNSLVNVQLLKTLKIMWCDTSIESGHNITFVKAPIEKTPTNK